MSKSVGPWKREDIRTNGIPFEKITGIVRAETSPPESFIGEVEEMKNRPLKHDELYKDYAPLYEHILCPVDEAYKYLENIYTMEEWTYTVRDLKPIGNNLYKGVEKLVPNTDIYFRFESVPEARTVDMLCAWDQGEELWMRYHFRLLDAMPTIRQPGTILSWLNCRHPYYTRDSPNLPQHIKDSMARKDRPMWVGDIWHLFVPGHVMELRNLKRILETRWASSL